ncbi:cyclin-dependent protein kinase inhibitor SMR4-like [Nymphaea colorata]|uniref:cyclin-dependent protein kinase inhibitor SMR4-like n=1 Tax=Nymphaea colorata TaxID=210225 RepID=UPI00129D9B17|nr:cyclin-dependent protein kinase inhibitor SMR4-like [Nymphaea colorata]
MEIVQMQSHDLQESHAKVIPQPLPQINVPRPEFADAVDPSTEAEKKGEVVTEEQERRSGDRVEQERRSGDRVQEECTTPKGEASRIPAPSVCPPPPARRTQRRNKRRREIPSEEFFPVPEDLNSVFVPRKKMRAS